MRVHGGDREDQLFCSTDDGDCYCSDFAAAPGEHEVEVLREGVIVHRETVLVRVVGDTCPRPDLVDIDLRLPPPADAAAGDGATAQEIWSSRSLGFSFHVTGGLQRLDHTYDFATDTRQLTLRCDSFCMADGGYVQGPVMRSRTLTSDQISALTSVLSGLRRAAPGATCAADAFGMTLSTQESGGTSTMYGNPCKNGVGERLDPTGLDALYADVRGLLGG